jgi:hypothetical protein
MKPISMIRFAASVLAIASATTIAAPPSFKVTRIYSNIDGTQQLIQLEETGGMNGQHRFAGLTLSITDARGSVTKTLMFPADLPNDQTAGEAVLLATGGVQYYSSVFAAEGETSSFAPDFVIPVRFIPTEGGTIDFAGADGISYPALPIDGWRGVDRDGVPGAVTFRGFHRAPNADRSLTPVIVAQSGGVAMEYYNATLDHYFVTASAADIDAIESGRFKGWERTLETFEIAGGADIYYYADPRAVTQHPQILDQPVCRFYIPPSEGDSHFLSASPDECNAVKARFPEFVMESGAVFYSRLPDPVTGDCPLSPYGTVPQNTPILVPWRAVYRVWNQRVDSNHRFTTNLAIRDRMVEKGYLPEGYGPLGVAFCVGPPVF